MNKQKHVSKTDREKPNRDLEPVKDAKGGGLKPVSGGGGGSQIPAPPPPSPG
jgi:hypothetical protein